MRNTDSDTTGFTFNFGASETGSTTPDTNYLTMAQFIADMQNIEANCASATNTKEMITKFRKIYYNGTGWNKLLIPDTESITTLPASAAEKAMAASHEVNIPNGKDTDNQTRYLAYDAAHIFAILDASNHNGPLSPLSLLGSDLAAKLRKELKGLIPVVEDRLMACGWLGDLSEIVGEFYVQQAKTDDAKQNIISKFGAYYKNLANVDGMVMVDKYKSDLSSADGKKLSALCVDYYGTDGESGERAKLKAKRYQIFATSIGLTWSDTKFTNQEAWVNKQKSNLRTCAAFYIAHTCLKLSDAEKKELESVLKEHMNYVLKNAKLSASEKQFALFLQDKIDTSANGLEEDIRTLIICFLMWIGSLDDSLSIDALLGAFADGLTTAIKETAAA